MINHKFFYISIFLFLTSTIFAQTSNDALITSGSAIDWTQQSFTSDVLFNIEKAGISMPAGKNLALDRINLMLPELIKDPLLSLPVDSMKNLGDVVLDNNITLAALTQIIQGGKQTPGYFTDGTSVMKINHSLNMNEISSLMIKHHYPYTNEKPVEIIPSRAYTGIIIDARGKLPVQGEFVSDRAVPCFFPRIWDEHMSLIYERNMMDNETAKQNGIVAYDYSNDESRYSNIIGKDPLRILAKKVYGKNRTDPLISHSDALKILTIPENLQLLREGKVVILLDKDTLIHQIEVPAKNTMYYTALNQVRRMLYTDKVPDLTIQDTYKGLLFQIDLKFYPDSPVLLPEENERIARVAEILTEITKSNEFSILVEGHAADVGKPDGELQLSIDRAQAVVNALQSFGVEKDLFSFKGYGSSVPVADNSTSEGRAQNRRVDITARPKATYIQRDWN